jgi:hypothetical protein
MVRYCEFEEMGRLEYRRDQRTGLQSRRDANALKTKWIGHASEKGNEGLVLPTFQG